MVKNSGLSLEKMEKKKGWNDPNDPNGWNGNWYICCDVCLKLDEEEEKKRVKTLCLAIKHLQHFSPSSHYGSKLQQGESPFSASQNWLPATSPVTATPISHQLNDYATTDLDQKAVFISRLIHSKKCSSPLPMTIQNAIATQRITQDGICSWHSSYPGC